MYNKSMLQDKDYIMSKMGTPLTRNELCSEFAEALNQELDKYISAWNKVLGATTKIFLYTIPAIGEDPTLIDCEKTIPVLEVATNPSVEADDAEARGLFGELYLQKALDSLLRQMSVYILKTINAAGYNIDKKAQKEAMNHIEGILALKEVCIKGKLLTTKVKCLLAEDDRSWRELGEDGYVPMDAVIEEREDESGNMKKGYWYGPRIGHVDYMEMAIAIEPKPVG